MIGPGQRRWWAYALCVIAFLPPIGAGTARGSVIVIPVQDSLDAAISINYDTGYDSKTGKYSFNIDTSNALQGPVLSVAPNTRNDPFRPFPGAVEESRVAMEFDLSSIGDTAKLVSVELHLPMGQPTQDGQPISGLIMELWSYAGDGVITDADFGDVHNVDLTLLDEFEAGPGIHSFDVTSDVGGRLGIASAGYLVRIRPPNTPGGQPTFYSGSIDDAGSGDGPKLVAIVMPEPSLFTLYVLPMLTRRPRPTHSRSPSR